MNFRSVLTAALAFCSFSAFAQGELAPGGIPGQTVYIPYPVRIAIDGKLDDWKNVPEIKVVKGPHVSKDPAENGDFSFRLAAEGNSLSILMLATDVNLISGKHGSDFWNEDSLEFYLNLGPDFGLTQYAPGVLQLRVVPSDIDLPDNGKLTLTGNNLDAFPFRAKVFKTATGWGFEGSVTLPASLVLAHGHEIGFQAQANGASVKDRNVKLIWSEADQKDNSWSNPSLFGRALFYRIGSTDLPHASETTLTPTAQPAIAVKSSTPTVNLSINQAGYLVTGKKTAVLATRTTKPLPWTLTRVADGVVVARGKSRPLPLDPISGDTTQRIDFSRFASKGKFVLSIEGVNSPTFAIDDAWVESLGKDALLFFYRQRSGMPLAAEIAGAAWARPAGHLSDARVPAYEGYNLNFDGSGGWYDAGDFGKYVVNGGISVWTLQNAAERSLASTPPSALPSLLDEARWQLEFMLRMQIPAGQPLAGMVFHKLHDRKWSGVPSRLPAETTDRFVYEPTTAATLNLAATSAQAARLWRTSDPAFAARCLDAAKTAWQAAREHPALLAGNYPGEGGGNYDDNQVADEFYWAAAELALSTGDAAYFEFLRASPHFKKFPGQVAGVSQSMTWADTAALGTLSMVSALSTGRLPQGERARLEKQIIATANRYLKIQRADGYLVPMDAGGYVWGSNSVVLNNAIILAVAADLTKKPIYRDGVVHALDYLLGMNSLRKSFVAGYGVDTLSHPHHRVWGNAPTDGYPPPPPGSLAGGPNANIQDPEMTAAGLAEQAIAKRYLDKIASYATNEVAINWNAPLVWVALWVQREYAER